MKMHQPSMVARYRLMAAAIFAVTVVTSPATMVNWGSVMDISGDADVSLNGTLVEAYNLGGPGVPSTSVNSVLFQSGPVLAPVVPATTGTWQGLSAVYTALLASAATLKADQPYVLPLTGLTAGRNYEFQTWVNNSTRASEAPWYYPTSVGDGLGHEVQLYAGDNGIGGGPGGSNASPLPGQYVLGTFTADASGIQEIYFLNGEIDGWVNGYQLREITTPVPEPGTLLTGLVVLGAFTGGFLMHKRKS